MDEPSTPSTPSTPSSVLSKEDLYSPLSHYSYHDHGNRGKIWSPVSPTPLALGSAIHRRRVSKSKSNQYKESTLCNVIESISRLYTGNTHHCCIVNNKDNEETVVATRSRNAISNTTTTNPNSNNNAGNLISFLIEQQCQQQQQQQSINIRGITTATTTAIAPGISHIKRNVIDDRILHRSLSLLTGRGRGRGVGRHGRKRTKRQSSKRQEYHHHRRPIGSISKTERKKRMKDFRRRRMIIIHDASSRHASKVDDVNNNDCSNNMTSHLHKESKDGVAASSSCQQQQQQQQHALLNKPKTISQSLANTATKLNQLWQWSYMTPLMEQCFGKSIDMNNDARKETTVQDQELNRNNKKKIKKLEIVTTTEQEQTLEIINKKNLMSHILSNHMELRGAKVQIIKVNCINNSNDRTIRLRGMHGIIIQETVHTWTIVFLNAGSQTEKLLNEGGREGSNGAERSTDVFAGNSVDKQLRTKTNLKRKRNNTYRSSAIHEPGGGYLRELIKSVGDFDKHTKSEEEVDSNKQVYEVQPEQDQEKQNSSPLESKNVAYSSNGTFHIEKQGISSLPHPPFSIVLRKKGSILAIQLMNDIVIAINGNCSP